MRRAARRLTPLIAALVAMLAGSAAARAQTADPPLNLSADNVTGSRGPEGDIVHLNGNVRITRGRTVITSELGRYLRGQGMLYLDGNVRLVDSSTVVTCDHAAYSEERDVLQVTGRVTIRDRGATLRAPSGTYDRRAARMDLYGGVTAADSTQTASAERATYWRNQRRFEARGKVRGEDTGNRTTLAADSVDYDRAMSLAVARGNPVLRSRDKDGRVAEVRAVTLRTNNELKTAEAIDSVRIVRDTLQARADYAFFDDRNDRGILLGNPRAWDHETVVRGDTLEVFTERRALRRFVVRGGATIDYEGMRPDTRGELSRLTGERIEVFFSRDEIDSLIATGQARNEYTARPRAGRTAEVNVTQGDTITVYFRDRKIDRALVKGSATGEYRFEVAVGDTAAARSEIVRYDAPRIEFIVPKDRIVLDQRSHLVYKELELFAKKVEFDSEKQTLVATGDPRLADRGEEVKGHLMTYDLETRTGNIYEAETTYEKGLYHGERIRKIGETELEVLDGSYSTCSLDPPHYRFASRRMKIYLRDKLVAKPVVFYVKNVPLLALPFYVFPIKPGRHSGFLLPRVEFGFNDRAGQFVRNAGYYWAPSDYFDVTVAGDYYQAEPSWVLRADGVYKLLYKLDGRMSGSFARSERDRRDRWDFNAEHTQEISPRTHLVARGQFVSSRDYQRDPAFGHTLAQRLNRFLTSSLALSHYAEWANFNVVVDRRQDLDADESLKDPDGAGPLTAPPPGRVASLPNLVQTVPSLSVGFPTRTLGTLPFLRGTPLQRPLSSMYFSLNSRFVSENQRVGFLDANGVIQQRSTTRRALANNSALTDNRRLFGWLTVAPGINLDAVVWDRDALGNTLVPAATWRGSLTSSATFYGTFAPNIGPLAGLRHVVFPSVSFGYSPEFPQLTFTDATGARRNRFESFSGIAMSGFRSQRMNFSLTQTLQAKLRRGETVQRIDNLLTFGTSGSYDFLWRESGARRGLSLLSSQVRLSPPGLITADASWSTDVYSQRPLRSLNYNVSTIYSGSATRSAATTVLPVEATTPTEVNFSEPWSVSLAYSYSGGYRFGASSLWSANQVLNGRAVLPLTPAWRLEYSTSYNMTGGALLTQRFHLTRDLHCWQASFSRSFNPGFDAEYWFRIGIKDQKEVYYERGTRQSSFGGIR